jgi:hypothetical protein
MKEVIETTASFMTLTYAALGQAEIVLNEANQTLTDFLINLLYQSGFHDEPVTLAAGGSAHCFERETNGTIEQVILRSKPRMTTINVLQSTSSEGGSDDGEWWRRQFSR